MLTEKALPIVLSVFVFSVCTSGATPFATPQGESSTIAQEAAIAPLTDAYLATVMGGDARTRRICSGLRSGANALLKVGRFFGSTTLTKAGLGLHAAIAIPCSR